MGTEKDYTKELNVVEHLGDDYTRFLGAIVPPIFQNSLFTRKEDSFGYNYTRVSNPTIEIAEKKIAQLEHGNRALLFSSGMAAITATLMYFLKAGDHVVAVKSIYGPVRGFLTGYLGAYGISADYVRGDRLEDFEAAIKPNTKLIYLESPSSNLFIVQDIKAICELAHSRGIRVAIDGTWATPIFQKPLELGCDVVIHSASKYLGGHSDIIGGVVVTKDPELERCAWGERCNYGANADPHAAWLLIRSLRTLPLRMKQHSENGMKVARMLEQHPNVQQVFYPGLESSPYHELACKQMTGFTGVMSFLPKSPFGKTVSEMKKLKYFEEGPSWGGFESLFNGPGGASEEERARTETPAGLIRISVGLEDGDSLCQDLSDVLDHCK
ncbi:MAG: PLP-dependent transferase [Oscillospiraceae bacterium]|nr:PLP-dependent transferase [Oscillospiraceae bacterium]